MNDKKFCFIICTNNEVLLNECLVYLSRLVIPEGYSIDLLTITEAKSMTSGYNEGMHASDAKYKIYMHQDVFIMNRYFLFDILDIFKQDEKIGMIGMVGYKTMNSEGIMWNEKRFGAVPMYGASEAYINSNFGDYRYKSSDGITEVCVADGLMLVTAADIEWDEEFDGWDFYDATQCMRFTDNGYRIVVPNQKLPWFIHDDGQYLSVWNYNKYRKKYLEKYMN